MLKMFSLLIALLCLIQGISQSHYVDSLKTELGKTVGRKHVETLYELGQYYSGKDSSISRGYIQKGISTSKKHNYDDLRISGEIKDAFIDHQYQLSYSSLDKSLAVLQGGSSLSVYDSAMVIGIIGTALTEMKAYEFAIGYRKKLLDINVRNNRGNVYYPLENIAYLFSKLHQLDSVSYYYDKALTMALKMKNKNWEMHCLNNMGHNFYLRNELDKSQENYRLAIENFKLRKSPLVALDSALYGVVLSNMASLETKRNNYKSSLAYRKEAQTFLSSPFYQKVSIQNVLGIIENYQSLIFPDSADIYFEKIAFAVKLFPELHADYYHLKFFSYELLGDSENATLALESVIKIQDSISQQNQMDSKVSDFIKFQTNQINVKLKMQQELQDNEKKLNTLRLSITIGATLMIVIILVFLFLKYKSDQKKKTELIGVENELKKIKIENQQIESKLLKEELAHKKSDLTDFAIDISRNQSFIKELLLRLKDLKKRKKIDPDSISNLISFTSGHSIIDDNLKLFQENVNKVNYEFTNLLVERFPMLTQNEVQLCSLLRLKLSSKEIASVKNITPDSVKVLRSRLRKKLNLDSKQDLQQFILNIE